MRLPTKRFRICLQAGFLVVLIVGGPRGATVATAQSAGTFTRTGDLTTARSFHTATLLPNRKVLIAGGVQSTTLSGSAILASTELYDPRAGTFGPGTDMTTRRRLHTATLLADGRVLIAGGYGDAGALASAELYDPSTGTFTATGNMITARGGHTAILLPNGQVIIMGGSSWPASYPPIAPAEIYDPVTGEFTAAGSYVGRDACDFCAPAILLVDGTVLFPGQYPAQVYDPVSDAFRASGMTISDQSNAVLLTNGKVLFAGGEGDAIGRSSAAELYDAMTGTFALTGSMAWRRVWHTLSLLPNGLALAVGGETDSCTGNFCYFAGSVASAELYDPSAGTFHATGNMAAARETHTATLLADGRVLIAGGVSYGGIGIFGGSLATAELYTPDVLVPAPALISLSGDGRRQGAIYHAGTSYLAAPDDPAAVGEDLDLYCTDLTDGSVIPPQVAIGGRMAAVLSFGRAPDMPGVNQVRVRVPSGIAAGPSVPVRLTYMDRPSNEVTIGVH
jgi:hypothetical protein